MEDIHNFSNRFLKAKTQLACLLILTLFIMPATPYAQEKGENVYLTLFDCYKLALAQSEKVALRQEEVERTQAQLLKAMSEALGDIDFVMTNSRQEVQKAGEGSSLSSTFLASSRRERKFTFSQPLFQGFKAFGAISGAGSLTKGRSLEERRARQLLFLDVVSAFYSVLQNKRNVEISQDLCKLLEERMADLKERERIGRSRSSEVANANSKLKNAEAQLALAERVLINSIHVLEYLTGTPLKAEQLIGEHGLISEPTLELADYLSRVEMRQDVLSAKQNIKTYQRNIIVAQSGLWPQISLDLNDYVKREGFQSGIDWDMLLTFDLPLFKGFETSGKIKEAVSEWKMSKLTYSLTKREAELEIKRAYENWIYSKRELKAMEEATLAAQKNFDLQKEEYVRSLVNNLDVLEALENLNRVRLTTNQVYYQMFENYWNLQISTEGFTQL